MMMTDPLNTDNRRPKNRGIFLIARDYHSNDRRPKIGWGVRLSLKHIGWMQPRHRTLLRVRLMVRGFPRVDFAGKPRVLAFRKLTNSR